MSIHPPRARYCTCSARLTAQRLRGRPLGVSGGLPMLRAERKTRRPEFHSELEASRSREKREVCDAIEFLLRGKRGKRVLREVSHESKFGGNTFCISRTILKSFFILGNQTKRKVFAFSILLRSWGTAPFLTSQGHVRVTCRGRLPTADSGRL